MLSTFTNDHPTLEKAIAQVIPGASSSSTIRSTPPPQNGEYDVQQDNGAAFTADETEFNVFNTDQKLEAVESLANVLEVIPGQEIRDRIHGRHYADGRRKPHAIARGDRRGESRRRFDLFD